VVHFIVLFLSLLVVFVVNQEYFDGIHRC